MDDKFSDHFSMLGPFSVLCNYLIIKTSRFKMNQKQFGKLYLFMFLLDFLCVNMLLVFRCICWNWTSVIFSQIYRCSWGNNRIAPDWWVCTLIRWFSSTTPDTSIWITNSSHVGIFRLAHTFCLTVTKSSPTHTWPTTSWCCSRIWFNETPTSWTRSPYILMPWSSLVSQ